MNKQELEDRHDRQTKTIEKVIDDLTDLLLEESDDEESDD